MTWLFIGLGGAAGSVLRYWLGLAMNGPLSAVSPLLANAGTLAANLLGSFLLVLIAELQAGQTWAGVEVRLILGTGMMGGFTTYSTFNLETYRLLQQGQSARAMAHVGITVVGCLLAAALAMQLVRSVRA